jgi:LacI family transcriptional regulator
MVNLRPTAGNYMDNVNLKKLAKELGLAVSTVSRALRDSHEISQETKERVKALAVEWGFQPNAHASSLRQNKSKTIGVIIPEIENNFFSQIINGIESIAQDKGFHVLIYLTHEDTQKERSILQLLRNGRVDGLMMSLSNTTTSFEHLEAWKNAQIPIVLFDRIVEELDVPVVTINDMDVSYKATEHLIENGCKKIVFLSLSDQLSISNRRKSGYLKALQKHNMEAQQLVIECGPDNTANDELIRRLLREEKPDGAFTAIEKLAINMYEVCTELKINIPEDLKLVSFSNSPSAPLFCPSLSAIVQPAYEMGKEAAITLFKLIEKKSLLSYEKKVMLKASLCKRNSSAPGRKRHGAG